MGASKYLPQYKSSCRKWVLVLHISYSNLSSRVVNLQGLDKYGSKHTGSRTNVQARIGGTYGQMKTDGLYRREGKNGVYLLLLLFLLLLLGVDIFVVVTATINGLNWEHLFTLPVSLLLWSGPIFLGTVAFFFLSPLPANVSPPPQPWLHIF